MPGLNRTTEKYLESRNSLREELRPIYDQLAEDYAFHTTVHHGIGYVAYKVIASLVESGWRNYSQKESDQS